jgi:hypothetical protein
MLSYARCVGIVQRCGARVTYLLGRGRDTTVESKARKVWIGELSSPGGRLSLDNDNEISALVHDDCAEARRIQFACLHFTICMTLLHDHTWNHRAVAMVFSVY